MLYQQMLYVDYLTASCVILPILKISKLRLSVFESFCQSGRHNRNLGLSDFFLPSVQTQMLENLKAGSCHFLLKVFQD